MKGWLVNGSRPPFYCYRDKDRKEIGLLIIQDGTAYPLECIKTASPDKNDVRHSQVLEKTKIPVGLGGVICLATQALPLTEKAWSIPAGWI
ncbi:MAG: hypothetical protein LBP92_14860 [Deltaproteobacteria bacterium]|nr:hypothetical protein [Deltaproteobacteria bacterium]